MSGGTLPCAWDEGEGGGKGENEGSLAEAELNIFQKQLKIPKLPVAIK